MGEQRSRRSGSSPTTRAMSLIHCCARRARAPLAGADGRGVGRLTILGLAACAAAATACIPSPSVAIHSGPACDTVSTLRSGPRPAIPTAGKPSAATASLVGIVVDAQTGIGISQSVLRLDGVDRIEILTERDGSFVLAEVTPGMRAVRVLRIGYENYRDSVELHANRVDSLVIRLRYYACR